MKKIARVGLSVLPLFVLLLLTPFVFLLIFYTEDQRWQVAIATVWIYGGVYVATWFHAKILFSEMNNNDRQKKG